MTEQLQRGVARPGFPWRRGLARAGTVLVTAAVLAVLRTALTPTPPPQRFDAGQCLQQRPVGFGKEHMDAVDCAAEHRAEVLAVFDLPAGDFPGWQSVHQQADEGCEARLPPSLAIGFGTGLDLFVGLPEEDSWGDSRRVTCIVGSSKPLTHRIGR